MMRIRLFLLVAVLVGLTGHSVLSQEQLTSYTVFTLGGTPLAFTSDSEFMVAQRVDFPPSRVQGDPLPIYLDVYRTDTFEVVASYPAVELSDDGMGYVELVAISHDTQLIAYVQLGGLYVFNRTTGETTQPTGNFTEFEALKFNPVNNLLAYVVGRGITVFDPTNRSMQYDLLDDAYGGTIASLAWSPDGRYLANGVYRASSDTFDVLVWDISALQPVIVRTPSFAFTGAEPNHVAWRDGDTLAAFGETGIMIYDVPSRSQIAFIPNPAGLVWSSGAWSPDGTQLIATGSNQVASERALQIWDVSNLPAYESITYEEGGRGGEIWWTPNGLFSGSRNGLMRDGALLATQLTATPIATAGAFTAELTASETPSPAPTQASG